MEANKNDLKYLEYDIGHLGLLVPKDKAIVNEIVEVIKDTTNHNAKAYF